MQRVGSRSKGTQRVGSRAQVMHGNAKMTGGGLKKKDLKYNKQGKIVSKKMSTRAKKEKRLQKAGYITKKGGFKLFKKQRGGGEEYIIFNSRSHTTILRAEAPVLSGDTNKKEFNSISITNSITIDNNETVEVIEVLTNTSNKDMFKDYMVKINYKGHEGYVRSSYLYKKHTKLIDNTIIDAKLYEKDIDIGISRIKQEGENILCSVLDLYDKMLGDVYPSSLDYKVPIIQKKTIELFPGETYAIYSHKYNGIEYGTTGILRSVSGEKATMEIEGKNRIINKNDLFKTNLAAMAHASSPGGAAAASVVPVTYDTISAILHAQKTGTHLRTSAPVGSTYDTAISELTNSPYQKQSHWVWYIFPTARFKHPNGRSATPVNEYFAIKSNNELSAYIKNSILYKRYTEMLNAVINCMHHGKDIDYIMGGDVTKLRNSLALFFYGATMLAPDHIELQTLTNDLYNLITGNELHINALITKIQTDNPGKFP